MALENVQAFYARLATDEVFRDQFQGVKSKAECSQVVKSNGYDFTPEEFEEYTVQLLESDTLEGELRDVDENELASVIGGFTSKWHGGFQPLYGVIVGPIGGDPDPIVQPLYGVIQPFEPPVAQPSYGIIVRDDEIA